MAATNESLPLNGKFMATHKTPHGQRTIGLGLPFVSGNPLVDPHFEKQNALFNEWTEFYAGQGIPVRPIYDTVLDVHSGPNPRNVPEGQTKIPLAIEITGEADIAKFISLGGKIITPGNFDGMTFRKSPTGDIITSDITTDTQTRVKPLEDRLKGSGIDYKREGDTITIEGDANLAAIALSGGKFTGSSEYPAKFGYSVGRS